jgi:hypothetical protein
MIVMSTQLIGFSIGGIARRFLVQPSSMSELFPFVKASLSHLVAVWPGTLVTCTLFNTLHSQTYPGIGIYGGISRERFFFYSFTASLIWC